MMRTQEMEVDIVEDPDIEEDEDCCVVRIAPKPIKIKIKPITKPDDGAAGTDFAIVTEEVSSEQKSDEAGDAANHVNARPPSPVTHMHPKKKIAHMDSLVNNYPIVNNLIHSTLNTFPAQQLTINLTKPTDSANSSSASSLSSSVSTTPTQNMMNTKSSSTPPLITTINLKTGTSPTIQPTRNGVSGRQYSTDGEVFENDLPSTPSPGHKNPPEKQPPPSLPTRERPKRATNGDNAVRRGRDERTKCDVCQGEGTNANLVRCDECLRCYHFGCLNPPVKKTPKVSGWAWSCSDCVPSDEDKGWHL